MVDVARGASVDGRECVGKERDASLNAHSGQRSDEFLLAYIFVTMTAMTRGDADHDHGGREEHSCMGRIICALQMN